MAPGWYNKYTINPRNNLRDKEVMRPSSLLLVVTLVAHSIAAFKAASGRGNGFFRDLKLALSSTLAPETTKYASRDAAAFTVDIKSVIDNGPIPAADRKFLINGWRWHTASALRDLARYADVLDHVATSCSSGSSGSNSNDQAYKERVTQCYSFVIDFNLRALLRVESDLFFPWLRRLLPPTAAPLMEELTQEQNDVRALSAQIEQLCGTLAAPAGTPLDDVATLRKIEAKVGQIQKTYRKIQNVQETVFVPYIGAFISRKEQERFNRKVIGALGMLQAQVHLVGMIEAIKDQVGPPD